MGKRDETDEPTEQQVESDFTVPDDADLRPADGPGAPGDEDAE